jgi:hypothetical protein
VYDMYPWAKRERGGGEPARERGDRPQEPAQATWAVQVALDRRDNGGDAAAAASQPTAGPTRQ